ncbi:hypothetical protein LSH36_922g01071 [Paralvinella palmiformis]|uniref:MAM domain-containing protein n=1 Tax=Paralvinella palmiformis TaxID=53620 RepID=A0AAD9IYI8_9ANNE|nr:hypothetical protein LSH36_922g01071 [Paralvinella palmiformis]
MISGDEIQNPKANPCRDEEGHGDEGQTMTGQLLYSCDYSTDLCGAVTDFWRQETAPAAGRPVSGPVTGSNNNKGYSYFPSVDCRQPGDTYNVDITFSSQPPDTYLSQCCLLFSFHVWGPDIGEISLDHLRASNRLEKAIWRIPMSLNDRWYRAQVMLKNCGTKVTFRGTCGTSLKSDLALDDVAVYAQQCPGE